MKKNILRVVSLLIVATMLFAFCSCKQEVLVRFVDKDGNDINIGSLTGGNSAGNNDATEAPADNNNGGETPATEAPATEAPADNSGNANETPATEAPADSSGNANETPATQAPAAETKAPAGNAAPTGKENVFNFYKNAVAKVKGGAAGYTKKEYQALSSLNLTGISTVDNAITKVAAGYMTTEADAKDQVAAKGSADAKSRFPECTLTDMSKVKSATCTVQSNGNYKITIIMVDEDTPKKSGSFLGKVTNSLLYWEDIDKELKNISIIKSYSNIHVIYKGYKIEAELTPAGNFVSMTHLGSVDIKIGEAKVLVATLTNKSGHLDNTCKYTNFKY